MWAWRLEGLIPLRARMANKRRGCFAFLTLRVCVCFVQANAELSSAERTLSNAWGMYSRTRPAPSNQSVRRTRQLAKEGVHPLLLALLPRSKYTSIANEAALAAFTERLKTFRPAATVLEADIARVRSTFTNPMLEAVSSIMAWHGMAAPLRCLSSVIWCCEALLGSVTPRHVLS